VAKSWTTGAHDYAETGANTRLRASDLIRGLAAFTSRTLNEIRPHPWLVRNAEVGSSSLLPSTNLRSRVMRGLPTVAPGAKAGCFLLIPSFGWQADIPQKRGSLGCLFLLYIGLCTFCGQIKRVERRDSAFERGMRIKLRDWRSPVKHWCTKRQSVTNRNRAKGSRRIAVSPTAPTI